MIHCRLPRALALRTLFALLGSTVILATSGCSWLYREEWIDPVYDLGGAKVIVVPFSKGDEYWYYEYSEGQTLAQAVAIGIQQECDDIQILSSPSIEEAVRTTFEDPMPWGDIAKRFGATHVLFGDVSRLQSVDPHRVGMFSGLVEFQVAIYGVEEEKVVLRKPIHVRFPGNVDDEKVIVSFAENLPRLRGELFHRAGEEVSQLTCGYYRDKMGN